MCPQRKAICFPLVVYCSTSTHPAARANLRQSRRFLPDQSALFCGILHILGEGGVFLPENRHLRFLLRLLYAALALAGLWLCVRFLLPWLLPFLLAWGLAALLEPAVGLLMRRLRLPRWGAAALCTAALAAALLGLLALALWRAWYELTRLVARLPVLLSGLPALADELEGWAYRFLVALPLPLQDAAREGLENLARQGAALPGRLSQALAEGAAGLAAALPSAALFLFTTLLAAYFTSAGRPSLRASLRRLMPGTWQERLGRVSGGLKTAFGGWLRAQGLLMLLTFGELALGFLLLRVEPALLLAGLTALVDALPVFGVGTVLLPWGAAALLLGDVRLGLGLLLLYGVVTLVRSLLEPRLVGKRVGLPPLAALACMYVGFRAFGVAGMVLAPLAGVLARQLWASGVLRGLFSRL